MEKKLVASSFTKKPFIFLKMPYNLTEHEADRDTNVFCPR